MITRQDLEENLLYQFKSDHELVKAIDELTTIFNHKRDKIQQYALDERLVSAYVLFYMSTNMPKLEYVLNLIPQKLKDDLFNASFVDIGCGPGTYMLALKQFWSEFKGPMYGLESSTLMCKQAKLLLPEHADRISNQIPSVTNGIVLFGHSANEMSREQVVNVVRKLDPKLLIFIEPGTKDSFRHLLEIRDHLVQRSDYSILYPCSDSAPCAILHEDNWCHQILRVKHDQSIERITQLAKKDRRTQPATIHLYVKKADNDHGEKAILFRTQEETKFSYEWEVCRAHESENEIIRFQVMKKNLSKSEQKTVSNYSAGQVLVYEKDKDLGHDYLRVKLKI